MKQRWLDLLFAHWRVPADALRAVMPPAVPVDEFDGSAWVGVTPFKVERLRARLTPPVPGISSFLETNVRTYATIKGEPGIWFFSLDAENRSAVAEPGTLEHFLTERYCLYTVDDEGRVMRGDIDHEAWRLRPAAAELRRN